MNSLLAAVDPAADNESQLVPIATALGRIRLLLPRLAELIEAARDSELATLLELNDSMNDTFACYEQLALGLHGGAASVREPASHALPPPGETKSLILAGLKMAGAEQHYGALAEYGCVSPQDVLALTPDELYSLDIVDTLSRHEIMSAMQVVAAGAASGRATLQAVLKPLNLSGLYLDALLDFGVETVADLREMTDEDWEFVSVRPMHKRKILEALGNV